MKADPVTRERAKELRRAPTNAERILWSRLRAKGLQGWQFRRQHPISCFITDFACPQRRLVVEVDGDSHASDEARRYDTARTAVIEAEGWRVIRFWTTQVYDNLTDVLDAILDELQRAPPPSR